jgi:nucleoside-diphosphate-sugar epimerase
MKDPVIKDTARITHTILGAGGVIANELVRALGPSAQAIRLVSRTPRARGGNTSLVAADLTDASQTLEAVAGSSVVYLLAGLKYDHRLWQDAWPKIMRNVIDACARASAKLIFFDNVYMYGRVAGAMTEETPFNPCSRKGEIRAQIATMLLDAMKAGTVSATIARAADFYGPGATNSVPNLLVFDKFAKGSRAMWLVNDKAKHSFTFTPDAGRSLAMLADSEQTWGETWHVPTRADPLTGHEFIELVAREFKVPARYSVLNKPMLRLAGLFDKNIREAFEMLYQSEADYVFDSSKFEKAFDFTPRSYADGVLLTAAAMTK